MRALITLGATREWIDDVRYISNTSSGTMGASLAVEGKKRGHDIKIIRGIIDDCVKRKIEKIPSVRADTSTAMYEQVMSELKKGCDVFISSAAVSDFIPEKKYEGKISSDRRDLTIVLKPAKKITAEARRSFPNLFIVAFKLEDTEEKTILEEKTTKKLKNENLNVVVGNTLMSVGGRETNAIIVKESCGPLVLWDTTKDTLAKRIWKEIEKDVE